ncbi:hypothetical protein MTBLM1_30301 [Rhodospirillaceae bacterium LM-1]|nr:hypothetical protein MTBLM1_30301 [Rhodospirillaceae bacterium LM-1]
MEEQICAKHLSSRLTYLTHNPRYLPSHQVRRFTQRVGGEVSIAAGGLRGCMTEKRSRHRQTLAVSRSTQTANSIEPHRLCLP